jgi:hypothetical protein
LLSNTGLASLPINEFWLIFRDSFDVTHLVYGLAIFIGSDIECKLYRVSTDTAQYLQLVIPASPPNSAPDFKPQESRALGCPNRIVEQGMRLTCLL